MHKQNIILLTIWVLLSTSIISGCNKNIGISNSNIDLINNTKIDFSLSQICDSIFYIPLDNTIYIKHLNEIKFDDNIFFCSTYPEGLISYNTEGKFINKIGKIGHGPGEYINGVRFTYDESNNEIYILNETGDILKYNYDGIYLNKTTINSKFMPFPSYIDFCTDHIICSYSIITSKVKNPFQWIIIDTLGNIVQTKNNTCCNFSQDGPSFKGKLTYKYDNKVHYWNHYNDTIYQLNKNNYQSRYVLNTGDMKLTPEIVSKMNGFKNIEKYVVLTRILESVNYLFITYNLNKKIYLIIFNKKNQKIFETCENSENDFGIINDFDSGPNFSPYLAINNYILIMWTTPFELKKLVHSDNFKNSIPKYPEKKKELEKLANSLNENDNPVLMLVKLKD